MSPLRMQRNKIKLLIRKYNKRYNKRGEAVSFFISYSTDVADIRV